MSMKKNTPKAKSNRRRQLERQGYSKDRIIDILEFEFDLGLGNAPGTSLPGKSYEKGGVVRGFSPIARPQRFKGVF
tara:strand:+ start:118 stop:345 length:228 start_codon:yes stop_codon:yes gene_type:complete